MTQRTRFTPTQSPERRGLGSARRLVLYPRHDDDGGVIGPNNPSSVSLPMRHKRFLGAAHWPTVSLLAVWRKGRVGASGGLEGVCRCSRRTHPVQRNNRQPNGAPLYTDHGRPLIRSRNSPLLPLPGRGDIRSACANGDVHEEWLMNPQAVIPGAIMTYRQARPEIRAAIITYLKGLS
jgi:hypothetical protein